LVLDEATISEAIVRAVMPRAREMAAKHAPSDELGGLLRTRISGYATPKPSIVAISFQVTFELSHVETQTDDNDKATLRIGGSCSYDPNLNEISDIEIKEWSVYLPRGSSWSGSMLPSGDIDSWAKKNPHNR
jgi:hypothetical protein